MNECLVYNLFQILLHAILLNLSCDCSSLTPLYHVLRWNASLYPSTQGFSLLCWREKRPGLPVLWDSEFMDSGVQLHKKERRVALVISELPPQPDMGWFGKFIICYGGQHPPRTGPKVKEKTRKVNNTDSKQIFPTRCGDDFSDPWVFPFSLSIYAMTHVWAKCSLLGTGGHSPALSS